MTTSTISMIDGAITKMSEGKGNSALVAKLVQKQPATEPARRIALAAAHLMGERRKFSVLDKADNGTRVKDMDCKPEHLLSFPQQIMNSLCWTIRRLRIQQERDREATDMMESAMLADFGPESISERLAELEEEAGIEEPISASDENLLEILDDDFRIMMKVDSWLKKHMSYITGDDLYIFAESTKDEETGHWSITKSAMTFDDALIIMEEAVEGLGEKEAAKMMESALTADFAA